MRYFILESDDSSAIDIVEILIKIDEAEEVEQVAFQGSLIIKMIRDIVAAKLVTITGREYGKIIQDIEDMKVKSLGGL